MRLEMIVDNRIVETWKIPESEFSLEMIWQWDIKERYEYRKAVVDRYIRSMSIAYADLIDEMQQRVSFSVTLPSKMNGVEEVDQQINS